MLVSMKVWLLMFVTPTATALPMTESIAVNKIIGIRVIINSTAANETHA